MRTKSAAMALALVAGCSWAGASRAQVDVWTHHNDNARTGANVVETQLTTATVNSGSFGKLWSYAVDGDIYTQPLVISNVTVPGKGVHDVVYVATMNDTVYAFDADDGQGTNAQPLWQVSFVNPAAGITPVPVGDVAFGQNIRNPGPIGVMGTPVIDRATGTMYLVARTKENGAYLQRLHALDIGSGTEKFGGPVVIQASVAGTGNDNVGGQIVFNPRTQNQRPGLALANGNVYIAWASHEDLTPYHGWLMAYAAATLSQTGAWCVTPDGSMAGLWQSAQPPSIDASGNVYVMTGNGSFDGTRNFGESIVQLNSLVGSVLDWFAPDDWATLNLGDLDLGSAGVLLIPGTNYVMGGGKSGKLFVLDRSNMGHVVTGNGQIVQSFQVTTGGHIHGGPVYWNGPLGPMVYVWGEYDFLKGFAFTGGGFATSPTTQSTFTAPYGMPGGFLSVSANASTPGSGIVWASLPLADNAEVAVVTGILRAFDASNLANELWDSRINLGRDDVGNFAKYVPPTVANGRVYLATFSNYLHVYGLLDSLPPPTGGALTAVGVASASSVDLTATGTSDWAHWPNYDHKATGGGSIANFTLLGSGVATYTNDPRAMTWSDGTPTSGATNNSGVFVGGLGNGFTISAPADTAFRTLNVYVGGWNSQGALNAYLSDGSALEINDASYSGAGSYDAVYTLTYHAASSGQRLNVQWTQLSGSGNVTLQGAALASGAAIAAPQPPTGVSATDGTSLTSVTVTWMASVGATSYTVYRSTAAGTQGASIGGSNVTTISDTTATPGTVYYYGVTASNGSGTSALSAQDSGYVAMSTGGGTLNGSVSASSATANLTAVGSADWAHWPGYDHKASGGAQVSNLTLLGTGVLTYADDPRTLTWSDGTPTVSGSNRSGNYIAGIGKGFQISAPATTTPRTLTVYVGGWSSGGKLTAHLSDGSAADYVDASRSGSGQYDGVYTLTYQAATSNAQLSVQWTQASGSGNVTIQAVALAGGSGGVAPSPPTGVSATDGTSSTSVTVTWTASAGATSYTVYRSTAAGTQGASIGTSGTTAYVDTTATPPGTVYYYGVTASNGGGTSALSAQDSGFAAVPTPAAPTGVSATDGTSSTSVTVTWTASAGATSYTMYRSTAAGTQGASIGTSGTTTFVDTTATPGTVYYYGVTASNGSGTSALSAQDSGFAAIAAPQPPTGVSATDGTSLTSVTVTWMASVGATSYTVYRSTAAGTQGASIGGSNVTTISDTTATPGTVYYYGVTASNGSGTSALSAQDSGYVAMSTGGGTLNGSVSASSATANLTAVGSADWAHWPGYDHKASGGAQVSNLTLLGTGVLTYADDPRTLTWSDGTPTVSGSNRSGNYIAGIGKGFQISAPATTTPRTLTVYVGGWSSGGKLTAHLSDGSAADYVDASRSGSGQYDGVYTLTYQAATSNAQLSVQWTQASGSGNVTIQAVALAGGSGGVAPSPPTGVSATDGTSSTSVTVTWTASAGATSYTVYRSTAAGTQGASIGTSGTTAYVDTTATPPGTVYYYGVTASNGGGTSALSAQDSGFAAVPTPAAPTGVSATDGTSSTSVTVTWTASAGATSYTVYRSTAAGTQGASIGTSGTTTFVDTTATPGTVYYYGVTASNGSGTSALSAQDSGYVAMSTGGGTLNGSVSASSATANLTAVGSADWAHWPGYDHKASGGAQVSNLTLLGTGVLTYANDPRTLTWSDGTPTVSGSNQSGNYIAGIGNGFKISVPADTTQRTLTVYVGGWSSGGKLTAHLSDGSAADYVDTTLSGAGQYDGVYTLSYKAGAAGQALTVQWVEVAGYGNVTLQGAALGVNVALAANGGVASASSIYGPGFPPSAVIDNQRSGATWGNGGGWNDATPGVFPDWVQINFSGAKTISRAVVYSVQDNYLAPVEPTDTMTFSLYGLTDFQVQGFDGTNWITLATVAGNNLVKRSVTFTPYTTDRIRIYVTNALSTWTRITEVEAWGQ